MYTRTVSQLECHFTFLCLQKSCTGNETALVATRHENDHLRKEIEQLSEKNAQLDFQLRQLQVLTMSDPSCACTMCG